MKYLQEGAGEITQEEFEAVLGPNVRVEQPTATQGYVATVEALEVTTYDAHTSCLIYLDVGPPSWLGVIRQNAGYLIIKDWKHEQGLHFCPVEIGGGVYDADAGETGAFTISLGGIGELDSFVVSGIGWKLYTNHQHCNIYASLRYGEEPPPPPPPPTDVKRLLVDAKLDLAKATLKIDEALRLLNENPC